VRRFVLPTPRRSAPAPDVTKLRAARVGEPRPASRSARGRLLALALMVLVSPLAPVAAADFFAALSAYERRDYATAGPMFETLAEQGDPAAQFMLAKMYEEGLGTAPDPVRAYRWYDAAAGQGDPQAAAARNALAARMTPAQLAAARGEQAATPAPAGDPAPAPPGPEPLAPEFVAEVQRLLTELGYQPGPVDGAMGPKTRAAISAFQRERGLPVNGRADAGLRDRLRAARAQAREERQPDSPSPEASAWERPRPAAIRADAELRSEPALNAPVIEKLAAGASVLALLREGAWYRVRTSGAREGWVSFTRIRLLPAGTRTAAVATDPAGGGASQAEGSRDGSGGGLLSGLARGVTGLFGASGPTPASGADTSTIGIRGLDASTLEAARPAPQELAKLERFAVADSEAMSFARASGLSARQVAYLPEPERPAENTGRNVGDSR